MERRRRRRPRSVVAYSAICAHKLTYPTRDISFISFRTEKSAGNRHANVIHCCSEHSQYDPAEGAQAWSPAPRRSRSPRSCSSTTPRRTRSYAVGTLGGEMFDEFFAKYEFRLQLEHGGAPGAAVARHLRGAARWRITAGNR